MTPRENTLAMLNYQPYERLPVISFGYWDETLEKWVREGHIPRTDYEDLRYNGYNQAGDRAILDRLGFDFHWTSCIGCSVDLFPGFEPQILETREDGSHVIRDEQGLIVLKKPGIISIPSEIGTSLLSRHA